MLLFIIWLFLVNFLLIYINYIYFYSKYIKLIKSDIK